MLWYEALAILIGGLMLLLSTGLPVAFSFFVVNLVGAYLFLGGTNGLGQLARNAHLAVTNFELIPIVLFTLMGDIMFRSGLAVRAIGAVDKLIANVPGRLSIVAVAAGTVFSALSGSSMANAAVLGSTLLPEMRRRGYHPTMAMGPILGTGGIAVLIPPSALAVLLGSLSGISISALLVGGILPGLVMAGIFVIYIIIRCTLNPTLAPVYEVEQVALSKRLRPFLTDVVPLLGIFLVVVGGIVTGIATPTESAMLGCFATLFAAIAYRVLRWVHLLDAIRETVRLSGMIMFIVASSLTFSQILSFSGATNGLLKLITSVGISQVTVVVGMLVVLLILGCFMDPPSMMMITLPFFMPLAEQTGVDVVWFGILVLIALEVSFTTPPFGLLLFVMRGIAKDTTMGQVCLAAAPFVAMSVLVIVLVYFIPGLATWLPTMLK